MNQTDDILYGLTPERDSNRSRSRLQINRIEPPDGYTLQIKDGEVSTLLLDGVVSFFGEYGQEVLLIDSDTAIEWCGTYSWLARGSFPEVWKSRGSSRSELPEWIRAARLAESPEQLLSDSAIQSPEFVITHNFRDKHDGQIILQMQTTEAELKTFVCVGTLAAVESLAPTAGVWIYSLRLETITRGQYNLAYLIYDQTEIFGYARSEPSRERLVDLLSNG